jgi:hypothetical protein
MVTLPSHTKRIVVPSPWKKPKRCTRAKRSDLAPLAHSSRGSAITKWITSGSSSTPIETLTINMIWKVKAYVNPPILVSIKKVMRSLMPPLDALEPATLLTAM